MPAITVKGMSCNHCVMSVTKALEALPGVSGVKVDLLSGKASFEADPPVDPAVVKKAIEKIGFEVVG
ncbi:MAG TPA: heavy metal-associated domain-containing protein [Humidesulfovibrio sp.]|uniref:heavy-metal-associated domain-containing protein n=1 Tax=Humidesulfovibrio sp. TaxID=2910988 RepID=UPI002C57A05B|nr:heavy metal-associated domain-containing protein [Humidesulfovibrio sp.]HWR03605.1 heavy metal-associated domain-containing protein [Humidesulfovibrio sp.]